MKKGCELAGPQARSAQLRSPLRGNVDFTMTSPRKATNIYVTGGATARGVGVGSTTTQVKVAFGRVKTDRSLEKTASITLLTIPRGEGGRLQFAASTKSHKVVGIGIPLVPLCD